MFGKPVDCRDFLWTARKKMAFAAWGRSVRSFSMFRLRWACGTGVDPPRGLPLAPTGPGVVPDSRSLLAERYHLCR